MSLAEELQADLEDALGEEEMDELVSVKPVEVDDVMEVQTDTKINSIHNIAKLRDSTEVELNQLFANSVKLCKCKAFLLLSVLLL